MNVAYPNNFLSKPLGKLVGHCPLHNVTCVGIVPPVPMVPPPMLSVMFTLTMQYTAQHLCEQLVRG